MKVLILAFGHIDNVFSFAKHVGKNECDLTVAVVHGFDRFLTGTIDCDVSWLRYGIHSKTETIERIIPSEHLEFIRDSFKLWIIKTPGKPSFKKKLWGNYNFIKNCSQIILSEKFDIIHFNGTGLFCYFFARNLKKASKIWTLHDFMPHSGEGRFLTNQLNKLIFKKFNYYIQHYIFLRKAFANYYKVDIKKVYQIYSGTFDIFRKFNTTSSIVYKNYILFFGRISPYKGLYELVKAYNELTLIRGNKMPKLVIAGGGKLWFDKDEIERNNSIIFLHRRIPTNELIGLIKNCLYTIAPYKDATHSAVVAVSYTFNKPCLASNVGGLSEVIENKKTGILIKSNNPNNIIEGLLEMNNEKLLNKMETEIKALCENGKLSWDRISKQYIIAYKETITNLKKGKSKN